MLLFNLVTMTSTVKQYNSIYRDLNSVVKVSGVGS